MAETLLDRLTLLGKRLRVKAMETDRRIAELRKQIDLVPTRYSQPSESSVWIENERRALRSELENLEDLSPALKRVSEHAADGFLYAHPRFVRSGELYTEAPGYQRLFNDCINAGLVVWTDQKTADANHDAAGTAHGRS